MTFAKAAAITKVSASTLSRKVARPEELLGLRLLERTIRRVVFTELGAMYFQNGRQILNHLHDADELISYYRSEPRGPVGLVGTLNSLDAASASRMIDDMFDEIRAWVEPAARGPRSSKRASRSCGMWARGTRFPSAAS